LNRTAGCIAANAIVCAWALGTHLNWLTWYIVWRLKPPKNFGTRSGDTSLASAHASVGSFGHGVPVISHSRTSCRDASLASALYLRVW
jgi:hypothetical protein